MYGGMKILNGDNFTTFGDLFSYTMFITMLFNPLRQIADKFNEMQLGMIAANRVLRLLIRKTKYKIQEKLKHRYLLETLVLRTFV
jgi:ABC-type multidrug transport system fused ATPase/permease subunit